MSGVSRQKNASREQNNFSPRPATPYGSLFNQANAPAITKTNDTNEEGEKKFPRANGLVDVYDKFYIIRLISRRTCGGGETVSSSTTTNRPSVCAFSGFCSESSEKIFHSVHASARNFAILHDFPLSFWRHPGPGDYRVIQLYETFVLSPIRRTNPGSLILLSFMPLQIAVTPAPDTCSRGANINSPRGSEIRET